MVIIISNIMMALDDSRLIVLVITNAIHLFSYPAIYFEKILVLDIAYVLVIPRDSPFIYKCFLMFLYGAIQGRVSPRFLTGSLPHNKPFIRFWLGVWLCEESYLYIQKIPRYAGFCSLLCDSY